jgi:predicted nucleotidyltransferase
MNTTSEGHRPQLLDGLRRFVASVRQIDGIRRIAVLGSIVTTKLDPKDIDVLVVVAEETDLAPLATSARRLQGYAQSVNRGADVFLADERGTYIGRTCHWKECRPSVRQSCDALHCGRRPYLHDDLEAIRLNSTLVLSPPVALWPYVERRGQLPPDLEKVVATLEHAV